MPLEDMQVPLCMRACLQMKSQDDPYAGVYDVNGNSTAFSGTRHANSSDSAVVAPKVPG